MVDQAITADSGMSRPPAGLVKLVVLFLQCSFTVFLALTLFAVRLPGAPAVDPAVWPDHGPYQTVGSPYADVIKMPVQVVEAVRNTVRDDPSTWHIYQSRDFSKHRDLVVTITGIKAGVFLLVERNLWIDLCVDGGVPFINDLKPSLRVADLRDEKKLEKYLGDVAYFQVGNSAVLTREFQRSQLTKDRVDEWLGDEKRPKVLAALCHNPAVTMDGDKVAIRFNLMKDTGAVEQWTFHLRVDKALRLETIDKVPLRKKDTFNYPLIH